MAYVQMDLRSYLNTLEQAWQNRQGNVCASLLSFDDPHILNNQIYESIGDGTNISRFLPPYLNELAFRHLSCVSALKQRSFIDAYEAQIQMVQIYIKYLQSNTSNAYWTVAIMTTIALYLRLIAYKADKIYSLEKKKKPGFLLNKSATHLTDLFRTCLRDSRNDAEGTKKRGILFLVNQMFKIYFKINQLHLCVPLIRTMDKLPIKEQASKGDLVTYFYFLGRKKIMETNFREAEEHMMIALEKCHKNCLKNKQLILISLIPLKMLHGIIPADALLAKYHLTQFSPLVEAVVTGNLQLYKQNSNDHRNFFIRAGIFLLVEKLLPLVYRTLFKRVLIILNSARVPIEAYRIALMAGTSNNNNNNNSNSNDNCLTEIDIDETQCILANLINAGYVKGYISLQHEKVVVSKYDPVPKLTQL